jgi:hypothetical protein
MMQNVKQALFYAADRWNVESLQERLALEGVIVNIPTKKPTLVGHNLNVQYDHHWAGGCNRIEMYEDALREWETTVWIEVRKQFIEYFESKIDNNNQEEIEYWTSVYNFLRLKRYL